MRKDIEQLIAVYSAALAEKGATPSGLMWPNAADLATRFENLLRGSGLSEPASKPLRLLDVGCGPGLLLDYLASNDLLSRIDYVGIDVFEATLDRARDRWPNHRFELRDVRERPFEEDAFDWALICGVFTGRFSLDYDGMEMLVQETLQAVWPSVMEGLSFNVMSKHVDWERSDLYHWPLDNIMAFCKANLSRHVDLRLNYGLWETAVAVRRTPRTSNSKIPNSWLTS